MPYTVNRKELGTQDWRDSIFLQYIMGPPDLPCHCNGFGVGFLISHAIEFKKDSLVTYHHIKLHDGVADLVRKALTPTNVRNNPLIQPVCSMQSGKALQVGYNLPSNPLGMAVDSE